MYLKNAQNGEVFAYSSFLAAMPNMVPCKLDGSLPDDVKSVTQEDQAVSEKPKAKK